MSRKNINPETNDYTALLNEVSALLDTARRGAARSVNSIMTATYWQIGRRIVVHEQLGKKRAGYGKALLSELSTDLTSRFGRGFSKANLEYMRRFYSLWPIPQTLSGESSGNIANMPIQQNKEISRSHAGAWERE